MSREEMLKQPNGAAISHIHSKGEQDGKFVYEVALPYRIRLLERPLAIVRMSDLEASRATLEPAGKEPSKDVRTLALGCITFGRSLSKYPTEDQIKVVTDRLQSHVDQQTRDLRLALEAVKKDRELQQRTGHPWWGSAPDEYTDKQNSSRKAWAMVDAALSTGNNLEVEKDENKS